MNNIEDIITDLKKGKMVILVDDEDRENEGDLLIHQFYGQIRQRSYLLNIDRG